MLYSFIAGTSHLLPNHSSTQTSGVCFRSARLHAAISAGMNDNPRASVRRCRGEHAGPGKDAVLWCQYWHGFAAACFVHLLCTQPCSIKASRALAPWHMLNIMYAGFDAARKDVAAQGPDFSSFAQLPPSLYKHDCAWPWNPVALRLHWSTLSRPGSRASVTARSTLCACQGGTPAAMRSTC